MTSPTYDLVLIGAGIVGAACAAEAVADGACGRVAVIDSGLIGGGATAAGMGHLVVMDESEPQLALTRFSQNLWRKLSPELPAGVEYAACGTIWVATDAEEMAEVQRKAHVYTSHGVPVEILDAQALATAEPNLRPGLAGGLHVPRDAVIYPPTAVRFLLERARSRGADILLGQAVTAIHDGGVQLADGTTIAAGTVVNATGAWAPSLTPGLEMQKRKGHLLITDRTPEFAHHQLIELGYLKSTHMTTADSVAFNLQPRATGQILIGSSRQFGVEDTGVDSRILAQMLARACAYMPRLASLSALRAWTGFRAATADQLPLIGPVPGSRQPELYLATGHEGLGITTSLGTARLLIDQITGRQPAIPVEPYLPARMLKEAAHA